MTRFMVLTLAFGLAAALACRGNNPTYAVAYSPSVAGGDASHGPAVIEAYGCGACHTIPGVRSARGLVGPPLLWWSRRTFIAGEVPNTPDFLIRWIEVPQAIEPGTAMPNLGVPEGAARNIAAYLYTLH